MNLESGIPILEPPSKGGRDLAPRLSYGGRIAWYANADDPRWQLARRIATSRALGRSRLLSDFLLYIVDRHICNREDDITEQQIGVMVFRRARGYDSNEDNIVRSYARNLRKRIDEYFETEGKDETVLLEIPRGGYAPVFSPRQVHANTLDGSLVAADPTLTAAGNGGDSSLQATRSLENEERTASVLSPQLAAAPLTPGNRPVENQSTPHRHRATLMLCIGLAMGLSFSFIRPLRLLRQITASPAEAASHRLWNQLFSQDRDTFIVPSDDGLIIMQGLTERPVPLASYIVGSYLTDLKRDDVPGAPLIIKLGARRFTNVVDLDLAARLAQLQEAVPERMMIRYARDLRMDDLRTGNAILIGSDESNPWIQLFHSQLHLCFRFDSEPDKPSGFVNLYPHTGEASIYSTKGQEEQTYGIIAYLPNLTNSGHVLIVAGLNTAGTQAAAAFLLDPSSMMPTLQRARTAHGGFQPFELLVGAGNVATNASTPHIVIERIGLPQGR